MSDNISIQRAREIWKAHLSSADDIAIEHARNLWKAHLSPVLAAPSPMTSAPDRTGPSSASTDDYLGSLVVDWFRCEPPQPSQSVPVVRSRTTAGDS